MNSNILLTHRAIVKLVKQPSAPLMGFGMNLFFLVVYNAGIRGIGSLDVLPVKAIFHSSGFSAGIMIRTRQAQSAAIVTNAIFPLLFLSTTFLPRELITAKWLLAVSWGNPATYIPEGCRYLLAGTSDARFFLIAVAVFSITTIISLSFALSSARKIKL